MSKSIVLVLGIFLVVVTVGNIHLMWQWCGWDAVARVSAATTAAAPAAFVISQQDEKRKNKADSTSFDREACLRDVLQNLPLGTGRPRLRNGGVAEVRAFAHHYDAGNRARWNANLRLEPIDASLTSNSNMNCSIWEVGANTEARDSRVFLRTYPPHCQLHAYEPIPPFFAKLQRHWQAEPRMTVHPYGLAAESTSFGVSPDKLKGQSTFIGESQGGTIQAKVVALSQALQEANHIYPKLLSINCEGCEWTLVPDLVHTGFVAHVAVVQIGFHNYGGGGVGARGVQLCAIRDMLSQTHDMVQGTPFAWERWVLRAETTR